MMDIYAEVTDRIIAELENGIIPWRKPWAGSPNGAISHNSGKPYSLLNQFLLGKPGEYVTFKQALDHGGNVKKGSKAKMIVFWKFIEKERKDGSGATVYGKDGKAQIERIPCLKYFNVFHLDDCEWIEPKWTGDAKPAPIDPIADAENIKHEYITANGIRFEQQLCDEASYSPSMDRVRMPMMDQFQDVSEYYNVLFHELTHSTGHPKRLDREHGSSFGTKTYAKEELIAEIGAASVLHALGIETPNAFRNSAAYVQNWLHVLRDDKRLIISAAGKAEKAVNLIFGKIVAASNQDADSETGAA